MAINSYIKSYVHQHALRHQSDSFLSGEGTYTIPGSIQPSKAFTRKNSLAGLFPLNQCSNVYLRDTKGSIRDGVEETVYNCRELAAYDRLRQVPYTKDESCSSSVNGDHLEASVGAKGPDQDPVAASANSILVRSADTTGRQLLIGWVNDIFMTLLKKTAKLNSQDPVDELVGEAVTYGTNVFIQGFSSSTTSELCLDILSAKESGLLNKSLRFTLEELIEHHKILAFDRFQDAIVDGVQGQPQGHQPPEQPTFFELFEKIWSLEPESFLRYRLEDVLCYLSADCKPFYGSSDCVLLKYESTAIKLNTISCYHALRRKYLAQTPLKDVVMLKDLKELEVLLAAAANHYITTKEAVKSTTLKPKTKTLRFIDPQ